MNTITVSPKYQILIPKKVRNNLHIKPGNKLQVFSYNGRIEIIPIKSFSSLKGSLKGINTNIARDEDRF